MIKLEYQSIKMFLQKVTLQISERKFLWLKNLKAMILKEKKLLEDFTKTNCKKQIKKDLELKRQSGEKVLNYMLNGKVTIIRLIVGSTKKTVQMSEYFPEPKLLGANVKVELHLSNYATKIDLKMRKGLIHLLSLKKLI